MALSPLLNVPVLRQDTTMDVVRKGDGSHEFDEVVVTTREREKLAKAIAKAAKGGISQSVLTIKPGQSEGAESSPG